MGVQQRHGSVEPGSAARKLRQLFASLGKAAGLPQEDAVAFGGLVRSDDDGAGVICADRAGLDSSEALRERCGVLPRNWGFIHLRRALLGSGVRLSPTRLLVILVFTDNEVQNRVVDLAREHPIESVVVSDAQAVRACARFADATRVLPAQLMWRAAQTKDVEGLVRAWLFGEALPGYEAERLPRM